MRELSMSHSFHVVVMVARQFYAIGMTHPNCEAACNA